MCVIVGAALHGPRVMSVIWWLLDPNRWASTFDAPIVPVLGVLLLPWTTLAYVFVARGGLTGVEFVVILIGFLADVATYGSSAYSND